MRNECDHHRAAVSVSVEVSVDDSRSLVLSNGVLRKIRLPRSLCPFSSNTNCKGLTHYRTVTGVCNHPRNPYQGSSQTAFGRLLPAAYDDGTPMTRKSPHQFFSSRLEPTSFTIRSRWSVTGLPADKFDVGLEARVRHQHQQSLGDLRTISRSRSDPGHARRRFGSNTDHLLQL